MRIIKKLLKFALIYIILFFGLTALFLGINPRTPDNVFVQKTIERLSILTPTIISYDLSPAPSCWTFPPPIDCPTETIYMKSFNPLFLVLNIGYSYLIYALIGKLENRHRLKEKYASEEKENQK